MSVRTPVSQALPASKNGVAAHGLVAAGAEKEGARDALARRRAHGACLAAEQQIVLTPERKEKERACHAAHESLRRQRIRRAAHLGGEHIALARRNQRVGAAKAFAQAEIDRVRGGGDDVADALVLGVRGDEQGGGRGAGAIVARYADREFARDVVLDVLLARPREDAVPDAALARRRVEVELQVLDLLVEVKGRAEAPGGREHVLVGIARL